MKKQKVLLFLLFLISTLVISACGDDTKANEHNISKEYEEQIRVFSDVNTEHIKTMSGMFNEMSENLGIIYNKDFQEYYEEILEEHSNFLYSYEFTPRSEEELQVDKLAQEVLSEQLLLIGATRHFLRDKTDELLDDVELQFEKLTRESAKLMDLRSEYDI